MHVTTASLDCDVFVVITEPHILYCRNLQFDSLRQIANGVGRRHPKTNENWQAAHSKWSFQAAPHYYSEVAERVILIQRFSKFLQLPVATALTV